MKNIFFKISANIGRIFLPYPIKTLIKIILSPLYSLRIFFNDLYAYFGKNHGGSRVIFVAGYPKSGTTWVEKFVSNIPGYSPRILNGSREILRHHNLPEEAFKKIPHYAYSAIKTHITPSSQNIEILIKNGIKRVIVMYRDPRDIAVSQYYHVLKNNPWKPDDPFYCDYNKINKNDAMSHSIKMVLFDYLSWVCGWVEVSENNIELECLVISYEDLQRDPKNTFRSILNFYGIKLDEKIFEVTMMAADSRKGKNLFNYFSSKQPGITSTKRNGRIGEWKDELNMSHKKMFKENIGDLLIELGYESDLNW